MQHFFSFRIQGIPCQIRVDEYTPCRQARRYEEVDEPASFAYTVCDSNKRPAPWLKAKVTDAIDQQIYEDFLVCKEDEYQRPYH